MATEFNGGYNEAPRGLRGWLFIFILCATQLFAQIALCCIIVPLNEVSSTFGQAGHEHAAERNWHVAAYSLTIGSFILVTGRLGDIYGAKNIFVIGWIWFGVWSVICGCSALTRSVIFFDVSRGFQGIGPALLLPNALAIAGRTFPPGAKKNMVFCMIAMCAPLGGVIGGLVGSAFAQYVWWPWAMWISGIACFVMAVMAYFVVPQPPSMKSGDEKITLDWIGSILGVGGLILLNVSWNQAPIDGWSTPYVYILLIIGVLLLVLFYFQEKRAKHPITDTSIFNARVIGVLFTTALGWSSFGVWFYYMFQFLQQERGVSSLGSAIQFIPGALSGMVAPIFTAWAIPRMSSSSLMIVASSAFFIGSLLQALAPVHQSYWFNTFWSFVIMAWGYVRISSTLLCTLDNADLNL